MDLTFLNIKHVSFDLWLTLIKSNPVFKQKRDELLKIKFEVPHPIETISSKIRMWDLKFNEINECSGKNMEAEQMLLIILCDLGVDIKHITPKELNEFYLLTEELFFKHHPVVIEGKIKEYLSELTTKKITISILSNTGFIKGSTLKKLLRVLELESFFSFQLYSDEITFSKPSAEAYRCLLNEVKHLKSAEILHIGDNKNADYLGATNNGLQSAVINSNNVSLLDIKIN